MELSGNEMKMDAVMGLMKVAEDNLKILHHNLVGKNFFGGHTRLGDYYEMVDKIADSVIELGISLGFIEPNLEEAIKYYKPLPSGVTFSNTEAFTLAAKIFIDIFNALESQKGKVPDFMYSKFEEYMHDCYIEYKYLIQHRLMGDGDCKKGEGCKDNESNAVETK